jgi:hypothetical protein
LAALKRGLASARSDAKKKLRNMAQVHASDLAAGLGFSQ